MKTHRTLFFGLFITSAALAQSINVTPTGVGIGTTTPGASLQVGDDYLHNQGLKVGISYNAANANAEIRGSVAAVGNDANSVSEAGAVAWNFYNAGNNPSWSGALTRFYGTGVQGQFHGINQSALGMVVFQNVNNGMIASNGAPIHIAPNSLSTTFSTNGNVGIGTTSPQSKLDVNGRSLLRGNTKIFGGEEAWAENLVLIKAAGWGGLRLARNDPASGNYEGNWAIGYNASTVNDFSISNNSGSAQHDALFHISSSTLNVGIGTVNPSHKFTLNGQIKSRGFITDTSNWSDYVLAPNYPLKSLEEVESHIKAKGHLPDVPSEAEIVSEGLDLGKMSATQMAQIEQLMLHVIALNKKLEAQSEEIKYLKAVINR